MRPSWQKWFKVLGFSTLFVDGGTCLFSLHNHSDHVNLCRVSFPTNFLSHSPNVSPMWIKFFLRGSLLSACIKVIMLIEAMFFSPHIFVSSSSCKHDNHVKSYGVCLSATLCSHLWSTATMWNPICLFTILYPHPTSAATMCITALFLCPHILAFIAQAPRPCVLGLDQWSVLFVSISFPTKLKVG